MNPVRKEQSGGEEPLVPGVLSPGGDGHDAFPHVRPTEPALNFLELNDRVVIALLFKEAITEAQVRIAWQKHLKHQAAGKKTVLWRILTRQKGVDVEAVFAEAATVYGFRSAEISLAQAATTVRNHQKHFTTTQWALMRQHFVVPIGVERAGRVEKWVLASHDVTNPHLQRLVLQLGLRAELRYLARSTIERLLALSVSKTADVLQGGESSAALMELGAVMKQRKDLLDEDRLEKEISNSLFIQVFEAILHDAVRNGASDIHIFPNANCETEIHFRIDGELQLWHTEKRVHPESFLAIVKDNALNVDRFRREVAQDGFIQREIDGSTIRFRVSVLPLASASAGIKAESIVLRVLDDRKVVSSFSALGFSQPQVEVFLEALHQPGGMVILTGPTGSGKTSTLYAALGHLVSPRVNALTIEDPVEYIIPGVRQIKLNDELTPENALRAVLRHDPDIVMVGEMRDAVTADLAVKLANTGHQVLSTLHTNDAVSAVNRLYRMGIEPFLLAYTINLVVAQRLLRKVCPLCRQVDKSLAPGFLQRLGFSEEEIRSAVFYKAGHQSDCEFCGGTGTKGRQAITENLVFDEDIRSVLLRDNSVIDEAEIRALARAKGMLTLQDSARRLVLEGVVTVAEMMRTVPT